MYQLLLASHNLIRWLVLAGLLYAIYRAWKGLTSGALFTKADNTVRHWTATIAHIQLMVGMVLYFNSPLIQLLRTNYTVAIKNFEITFFGLVHSLLMLTAIVFITIGSAKAKRKPTDKEKFKTVLIWFSLALILIFMAIPWPFSPFVNRPYFR